MADISFHLHKLDDIAVLKVGGELYSKTVPDFDAKLGDLIEQTPRIILDFSSLEYICSAAIGCLIGYANQAEALGGKIVVTGISRKLNNILNVIGFPDIVEIVDSITQGQDLLNAL